MRLTTLEISRVEIPFRVVFKHASAERRQTATVWVEARAATGQVGLGEGCPRSYVTGESLASARRWRIWRSSLRAGEASRSPVLAKSASG